MKTLFATRIELLPLLVFVFYFIDRRCVGVKYFVFINEKCGKMLCIEKYTEIIMGKYKNKKY